MTAPSTPPLDDADRGALARAVQIAPLGRGFVEPNPIVGAVLYRADGTILAEGHHREYGEAHAERDLVNGARALGLTDLRGLRMAVTLEPCSSVGKQPACVDLLRPLGLERIVVGCTDPDPRHRGRGFDALRSAGLSVLVAEDPASQALLAEFVAHRAKERPYVLLKYAAGLDGRWAPCDDSDRRISSEESGRIVHRLRAHVDAILVGAGTVLSDDPLLTARPAGARPLLRVVLDGRGRTTASHRIHRPDAEAPSLRIVDSRAPRADDGPPTERVSSTQDLEGEVLPLLRRRGVERLLLEGGPTLAAAFLDRRLVDRAWVFVAPRWYGGEAAGGPAIGSGSAILHQDLRARCERVEESGCDAWLQLSFSDS